MAVRKSRAGVSVGTGVALGATGAAGAAGDFNGGADAAPGGEGAEPFGAEARLATAGPPPPPPPPLLALLLPLRLMLALGSVLAAALLRGLVPAIAPRYPVGEPGLAVGVAVACSWPRAAIGWASAKA